MLKYFLLLLFSTNLIATEGPLPPAKIPVAKIDRHNACPTESIKSGTNGEICGYNGQKLCSSHCGTGTDIFKKDPKLCRHYNACFASNTKVFNCNYNKNSECRSGYLSKKYSFKSVKVGKSGASEKYKSCTGEYVESCKVGVKYPCCVNDNHPADKNSPKTCKDEQFGVVTKVCKLFTNAQIIDYVKTTSPEIPWASQIMIYARANYSRYKETKKDLGCLIKNYEQSKVDEDVFAKIKSLFKRKYKEEYNSQSFDCKSHKPKPIPKVCTDDNSTECDHIIEYNEASNWFNAHLNFIPILKEDLRKRSKRDTRNKNRKSIDDLFLDMSDAYKISTQNNK